MRALGMLIGEAPDIRSLNVAHRWWALVLGVRAPVIGKAPEPEIENGAVAATLAFSESPAGSG
jgi:hypothetical protein